ncbi:MAG TPA: hypothetical protein VF009_01230 [Solirubrobacterales bacterium]
MKLLSPALCCAGILLICGCGRSAVDETVSTATENTQTARQTSHPTAGAGAGASSLPAQDLLTRPTPRPPDVNAQFEFVGGAGPGACFEMGNPPGVRVLVESFPGRDEFNERGIATYGQPLDVCFDGLGRGPISVSVKGPKGFAMTGVLPRLPATHDYHYNNEWSGFDWVPAIEPSWPQGRYLITARSGSIRRSHSLIVVPPKGPGLRVLGPSTDPGHNSVPPNSHARLFITGFKGSRSVELVAYRTSGFGPHAHFFSAAQVPIPASGNTVVEIPTGPEEGQGGNERTFIITARFRGETLFAPFSIVRERKWASDIVGALPPS